ncbi:hypothetical protein GT204_10900 [Streptomyces sp. SID4919]|uniref:hypothetical protein n=1 Tax=unclassified Streptomyces TaxID=2593676 RepID=UPI0011836A6E|nr:MULTISPECIES: hypothetical protein [unclassified Streptomyces]MYY09404.1 hypothetical protein [Streptomyces sp. SID4919]
MVAAAVDGGPARPESALASPPELAVFGPSREAEFLGGTINRKLETQADAIVVTDLADLIVTYHWNQPNGVPGADTWRVTAAGTKAHGMSSVTYDLMAVGYDRRPQRHCALRSFDPGQPRAQRGTYGVPA